MSILTLKILLFCLVPVGLFILFKGIMLLRNTFTGKVLLDLPYLDRVGCFTISKSGIYSIWQKGPLFKKTPIAKFRPQIRNTSTDQVINLSDSLMSPRSNNFSSGSIEMFTFNADAGDYELKLVAGSSVSSFQKIIGDVLPLADMDLKKYAIEVRKSQSQWLTMLSIPIMLLGFTCTLGGFVLGLLADQIFI
ncbi:hypothetical protein [Psychrobacter sp. DAB_AL62B]|uniref:hypothetical protein n=1 Tax=Psychrobacter sp. DAB_AL62B TaxID=1028420 RepID=UPI002380DEBE|nr:hypothetical protein [Psychrobacter sp. DAB_AL62B]MDE4455714.1 hypothetical protein [Psychrobacter sp. DAB_AL62B]